MLCAECLTYVNCALWVGGDRPHLLLKEPITWAVSARQCYLFCISCNAALTDSKPRLGDGSWHSDSCTLLALLQTSCWAILSPLSLQAAIPTGMTSIQFIIMKYKAHTDTVPTAFTSLLILSFQQKQDSKFLSTNLEDLSMYQKYYHSFHQYET